MKRVQFFKPIKEQSEVEPFDLVELLLDPIRSKIIFEVILRGEATAEILVEATKKSRSTISHHLKKLVEHRILEVFMNPTGKTKFYRLNKNLSDFLFRFDVEEFSKSPIEDRSSHIMNLYQLYAIVNHIYANVFSDQIKIFQKYTPFEEVDVKNDEIGFRIKDKEIKMPAFSSLIIGEKQAAFLRKKLREAMKEYHEEFRDLDETLQVIDSKSKYLVKIIMFPYFNEQDFD
jgi:DNA-binding transcriptional ArsR family regulator